MQIRIDPEFQSLIPPMADEEYKQLEENILAEGCRDALVLWGDVLIDGHNRHSICTEHGLPFQTVSREFESAEDAIAWICKNQCGRRNISDAQKAYLRGKQYEAEKRIQGTNNQHKQKSEKAQNEPFHSTAEKIAKEHGVGKETIKRDAKFARAVDAIGESSQEVKRQILSGKLNAKKKDVIKIAEKPEEERVEILTRVAQGEAVACVLAKDETPAPEMPQTKTCKRCGKEKPLADFQEGRNVCHECRVFDGRGRKFYDVKGNCIESSAEAMELMAQVGDAVYRDITDLSREVNYGIDEFMMELGAVVQTFIRQTKDSVDEHPELLQSTENRQKIIAALSEAETAITSIKENLYE